MRAARRWPLRWSFRIGSWTGLRTAPTCSSRRGSRRAWDSASGRLPLRQSSSKRRCSSRASWSTFTRAPLATALDPRASGASSRSSSSLTRRCSWAALPRARPPWPCPRSSGGRSFRGWPGSTATVEQPSTLDLSVRRHDRDVAVLTLRRSVLDHQAAILHDEDAGARQRLRRAVVADPALQPHGARMLGEQIGKVLPHVRRAAEDIDDVDLAGNVGDLAVHLLSEDFLDLGEVNRDRDDGEAHPLERRRHVERRLTGLGLGLDAEHGHAAGRAQQLGDAILLILDQVPAPLVHGGMVIQTACRMSSAPRAAPRCPAKGGCRKRPCACCRTTSIPRWPRSPRSWSSTAAAARRRGTGPRSSASAPRCARWATRRRSSCRAESRWECCARIRTRLACSSPTRTWCPSGPPGRSSASWSAPASRCTGR